MGARESAPRNATASFALASLPVLRYRWNRTDGMEQGATQMMSRAEIDGLPSVAVAPLIMFHPGLGAFGGGYVGVDVFFFISGYPRFRQQDA